MNDFAESEWWRLLIRHRDELIHRKNRDGITPQEQAELDRLEAAVDAVMEREFPARGFAYSPPLVEALVNTDDINPTAGDVNSDLPGSGRQLPPDRLHAENSMLRQALRRVVDLLSPATELAGVIDGPAEARLVARQALGEHHD